MSVFNGTQTSVTRVRVLPIRRGREALDVAVLGTNTSD